MLHRRNRLLREKPTGMVEQKDPRGSGVDGLGMSPEEAAQFVAAGKLRYPPLGVYRDATTYAQYKRALAKAKQCATS